MTLSRSHIATASFTTKSSNLSSRSPGIAYGSRTANLGTVPVFYSILRQVRRRNLQQFTPYQVLALVYAWSSGLTLYVGTITEYTTMEHRIMIDYEEYEALPKQDKWMAHPTLLATTFFRLWKRKFEKLVWMALYNPRGRLVS